MENRINTSQRPKGYSVISQDDLKCVWMTAGLLTYKLCKYNLQCEKCPLDWELRNLSSGPLSEARASRKIDEEAIEETPTAYLPKTESRPKSEEDLSLLTVKYSLFYHPGHTWIKVEGTQEVRIGIDQFLAGTLGKVNAVLFSNSRRRCTQGKTLCSIIQEEGILHIVSPISGEILAFNPRLRDDPDLVRRDPLGEGYLLTLRPKNLQREQRHFLHGEAAALWCRKEWERLKEDILLELSSGDERLGMTMQDGGVRPQNIKKFLPPERYVQLINAFLRKGEVHPSSPKHGKGGE